MVLSIHSSMPEGWCSLNEAAKRLHCSDNLVRRLIDDGKLEAKKIPIGGPIGFQWLISLESLARFEQNYQVSEGSGNKRTVFVRRPESLPIPQQKSTWVDLRALRDKVEDLERKLEILIVEVRKLQPR